MDALTQSSLFPYFGGKRMIADTVWRYFGDPDNYVEPFFGTGAVLFARESPCPVETVNDADCFIANFWRAVQAEPETVAQWADWPVNEADLHARHRWLMRSAPSIAWRERMKTDPEAYDAKIAGWWVWGLGQWIGSGWCAGGGLNGQDGGPSAKRPHLWRGRGVHRQLPNLGDMGRGVHRKLPNLGDMGRGVHRKLPRLSDNGTGVHRQTNDLSALIARFADRLRRVRVCCGDWTRVLVPCATTRHGVTAVFLDPPYSREAARHPSIYAVDDLTVALDAQAWALAHGDDPNFRIVLCGYEDEHVMPDTWRVVAWRARGGYANMQTGRGRENRTRERLWISPHCERGSLLDWMDAHKEDES